ncbi:DUF2256 domain-containing protein [Gluconobacter frateurii]
MFENKFTRKICGVCLRSFSWRGKWRKDWDPFRY